MVEYTEKVKRELLSPTTSEEDAQRLGEELNKRTLESKEAREMREEICG